MVYKVYFYEDTVDTGKVKHKKSTIWQRNSELCKKRYVDFKQTVQLLSAQNNE